MATITQEKPKRKVAMLADGSVAPKSESLYQKALRRLWNDRLSMFMIVILVLLVIFSLAAPLLESYYGVSYRRTSPSDKFQPFFSSGFQVIENAEGEDERVHVPCASRNGCHVLGTDDLGRDHFARLARAGQISLGIAFAAAMLSLTIGVAIGVATGFYGGIVDDIIMWMIATITSIPSLFLLVIVAGILRPGPLTLILVLGLLGWTGTTRLVRGETLSLRERDFVTSARAIGASDFRIMFLHLTPNLVSILVVTLAIDIGALMLAEAALSFLGLGVQPPTPTWGNMLAGSLTFFQEPNALHLAIIPGIFITLTVLCLYVIGDGVRDAFDVTLVK